MTFAHVSFTKRTEQTFELLFIVLEEGDNILLAKRNRNGSGERDS